MDHAAHFPQQQQPPRPPPGAMGPPAAPASAAAAAAAEQPLHPHLQLQTHNAPADTAAAAPPYAPLPVAGLHPPMLPSRPPPKKRNRAALSCVACRERKIKCSRQIPCDQCTKRGDEAYCRMAAHPRDEAAADGSAPAPARPRPRPSKKQHRASTASSNGSVESSFNQSIDHWHNINAPAAASASTTAFLPAADSYSASHPLPFPSQLSMAAATSSAGSGAASSSPAAVELAAIRDRLAQLEASLARAEMQAAHNAAAAAAAGVSIEPYPSAPPPAPGASLPPGRSMSLHSNIYTQPSPHHHQQQQQQQQQQQRMPQDNGDGVDSDTEDAAAVLEGLAFCGKDGKKNMLEKLVEKAQDRQQQNASQQQQRGTSASVSGTSAASRPSPANYASSSLLSMSAASDPASSATSPATASADAVLRDERTSLRNKTFRLFLEADKERDIMLPDGNEPPEDTLEEDDDDDDESAIAGTTGPADPTGDEEFDEDEEDEIDDAMDVDASRAGLDAGAGPAPSTAEAEEQQKKKNYKSAQRLMARNNKVLSAAYKGAASMAKSQVTTARKHHKAGTPPVGGGRQRNSVQTQSSLSTASSALSTPNESAGVSPASGAATAAAADSTSPAADMRPSSDDPSAAAKTGSGATHIRGPTAEAYDLSRGHQGLFRVIVHGESMLGFGLGWPFAAAEANGDYKVIKGIGACPGNTQREAVLRAIIRTIPDREVVDQLLSVWEENVSFLAGKVIHVPTLRKEMETFFAFDSVEKRARVVSYVDPGWLAVLLMVFVTAMQFWPCNSSKSPSIFDGRSQSMWYAAAKSALVLARYQSSQSLSVLQSIILINLHAQEPGRVQTALMRTAINNAMDLRLHRLGDADKELTANGSCPGPCQFVRRQIELRIWWALVFRDWTSSACTSTYIINPEYFNTPMPANLNEHELCQSPTPKAHPPEVATEMSYVLANIELAKAVRISTDLSNKSSIQSAGRMKSLRAEDVQTLDQVYRDVLANAPPFFRAGSQEGEGTNLEVQRWLFVQAVFHKLLNLHRPRISSRTDSRVVCVLLARSILDMQSKLRQRCCVVNRLCHNLLMSFSAASLLCLDLLQSPAKGMDGADPALRLAIRNEVGEALEALRSVAEENHTAQRMYRIIQALLAEEEHRWLTAGSAASTPANGASLSPADQFAAAAAAGPNAVHGTKRKRSEPSLGGGGAAAEGQMTAMQRKKELLRLAKRVAEAAQEQMLKPGQTCPLKDFAEERDQQARLAVEAGSSRAAGAASTAAAAAAGGTSGAGWASAPAQGASVSSSVGAGNGFVSGDGSGSGPAAFVAGPAGPWVGGIVSNAAPAQGVEQSSSTNPYIMPTPSLAEHPYFTNKDVSSFTAPTQPTFANQNVAVAPNGMDLQAPAQSQFDASNFDLDSFMALVSSQQAPSANNGSTSNADAAAEAAAAAAAKWFTDGAGNNGTFGFGGASQVLPSPSASASSGKDGKAARSLGAEAAAAGALPTPPQSDSAGSSSGQSPPATGADAGTLWFWNWVLDQGLTNHAAATARLPVLQQVEDQRRAFAAGGQGAASQPFPAQQQAQQVQQQPPPPPQQQQQQQQQYSQAQQYPTGSSSQYLSTSPDFLTVPPIESAPPAGPKTPAAVRHLPSTPSSYFSSHFFTPSHGAGGGGGAGEAHSHGAGANASIGNGTGAGASSLAVLAANANVGTPSSNLASTGSSGAGAGAGLGIAGKSLSSSASGQSAAGSGSSFGGSGGDSLPAEGGGGSGGGAQGSAEDAFGQFGVWMQAPSLFDYADDLGIAEGGSNISANAGYLASLFAP